jgi:hypothetical protein
VCRYHHVPPSPRYHHVPPSPNCHQVYHFPLALHRFKSFSFFLMPLPTCLLFHSEDRGSKCLQNASNCLLNCMILHLN